MNRMLWTGAIGLTAGVIVGGCLAYAGAFNVAADDPHWDLTTRALTWARERSIASQASEITAPNLADQELIELGAEHYAAMCEGCHLAPGAGDNELRQGLYPKPPDLTRPREREPSETFWIIKHGIKMSAMPAWGVTHDDRSIWGLTAFLQQLPSLDRTEYRGLTGTSHSMVSGEAAEGHGHEPHAHDHGTTDDSAGASGPADGEAPKQHIHADEMAHEHND